MLKTDTILLQAVERGARIKGISSGLAQAIMALVGNDEDQLVDGFLAPNRRNRLRSQRHSGNFHEISSLHGPVSSRLRMG
jgi:hypothetical protein